MTLFTLQDFLMAKDVFLLPDKKSHGEIKIKHISIDYA